MSGIQYLIFAEKGTNKKCMVPMPKDKQVVTAMKVLNEKQGGDWVMVDNLQPGEAIIFNDDFVYRGYSPDIPRYIGNSLFKFEREDLAKHQ